MDEDRPRSLRDRNLELEILAAVDERIDRERERNDRIFAGIWTQRIVFAFVGFIALSFMGGLAALLINYKLTVGP